MGRSKLAMGLQFVVAASVLGAVAMPGMAQQEDLGDLRIGAAYVRALGVRSGQILLWCGFFGCATAVVLSYSLFSRRYPKEMAGRVNTALNVFVFAGMFSGQWAVGAILSLWPQGAAGYAPQAYAWALGGLWLVQFAGLAWLWSGRRLFQSTSA